MRSRFLSTLALIAGCCPQTRPDAWSDCWPDPGASECGIVLTVDVATVDASTPAISCSGFAETAQPEPCTTPGWPGAPGSAAGVRDGRFHRSFLANSLFGYRFDLELETTSETGGRARFCRSEFTDVPESCPPADWMCATAGTITLSEDPRTAADPEAIHGAIHVAFARGETVDATF